MGMRPLIAGNWKMNGLASSLGEIEAVARIVAETRPPADILVCPPATLIARAVEVAAGRIAIGGQDCHAEKSGAFTGDVSAEMLKDAGASAVILGHSERRHYHGESDADVAAKTRAAWRARLTAIVCVGETESQRDEGEALNIVAGQIAASLPQGATPENVSIAYEPVWAIGTGRTPTLAEIAQMHAHIRKCLGGGTIRILYGGSVKPANAAEILAVPEVAGALVGGASLKAEDFRAIFSTARPKT
jgi:triosephosphate isomerase (TIM)